MAESKSNTTTILAIAGAVLVTAALLFFLRPGKTRETAPKEKPPEIAAVVAPAQPRRVEAPPPAEPEPPPAEAAAPEDVRAALLGTNKKPDHGITELAERAATQKDRAPIRPKKKERVESPTEDDEPVDNMKLGGGLSDAEFYSTMERWRGVKSCLASGTSRNDELRGEANGALRISLEINGQGEVLASRVFDPSNDVARSIAPCVERSAKQLKFPAFEAEASAAPVKKVAKFVF